MATETVQVRDPAVCTRSALVGYLCLSPASGVPLSRADVERQGAIVERRREIQRIASVYGLPPWMIQPCYHGEAPSECLLGVDDCRDAKFCLKRRLAEYAGRDEA